MKVHDYVFVSLKVRVILIVVPFCLCNSVYIKLSMVADILAHKTIKEIDITILFSDLVSLIVPLQT